MVASVANPMLGQTCTSHVIEAVIVMDRLGLTHANYCCSKE